ncbi:hypothetical protein IWX50DRAFT_633629 [Phyllosticta citricarpa]
MMNFTPNACRGESGCFARHGDDIGLCISKSFTAASPVHLFESMANTTFSIHLHTPMSSLIPSDFVLPGVYVMQHAIIDDLLAHRTGMPRHENLHCKDCYNDIDFGTLSRFP